MPSIPHEEAGAATPDGPFSLPDRSPAESPALSMLRSVWAAYLEAEAGPDDVLRVLDQVTGFVQFELETLRQQAQKGISDAQNPTYKSIVEAFELHLEAIEVMAQEFSDDAGIEPAEPGEYFLEGFELAQEATQELIEAHRSAMDHIQDMANLACMFCAHANPREADRCAKCGRTLPGAATASSFSLVNQEGLEADGPAPGEVTKNFAILAQAVEGWQHGVIQAEELLHTLEEVEQRLACHQQESLTYHQELKQAPPHAQAALAEAVAMTEEGLAQSLAAIDKMKLSFDKEDDSYLESGLHDFEKASRLMMQAYHASKGAAAQAKAG